jgi:putative nucleotidyltransferase with HDIG domain
MPEFGNIGERAIVFKKPGKSTVGKDETSDETADETADGTPDTAHYVSADQLQIGLYVFIDQPWFQHPFALNSFRIADEKQIGELRALGKTCFRFDPQRSEAAGITEIQPPAGEPASAEPAEASFGKPRISLLERQSRIGQIHQTFQKSVALMRHLNHDLTTRPQAVLQEMDGFVEQMTQEFLENPAITLHLMGEERWGEDIYSHNLNVTVLGMMLAKGLGLSAEQTRVLGLGALLHDIGLGEMPDLLRLRSEEYTPEERKRYAMHPELGLRIGKELGLPAEVLSIIHQHHEMVDGSGYPLGLKGDRITLPARIVSLVNFYDRLCNPADPAQAMTPHGALSLMFGAQRGKFDKIALERFIRCLGVYPPGSIVTLSNDAIALVLSINPVRPLRPWVMVYDKEVPREEAILLDLERETEVNIVGALRPVMLPQAVATYLSPRKRVVYFFDSEPG